MNRERKAWKALTNIGALLLLWKYVDDATASKIVNKLRNESRAHCIADRVVQWSSDAKHYVFPFAKQTAEFDPTQGCKR